MIWTGRIRGFVAEGWVREKNDPSCRLLKENRKVVSERPKKLKARETYKPANAVDKDFFKGYSYIRCVIFRS